MPDFLKVCADAVQVLGHNDVIRNITGSRNDLSAAAILNFVFREYLGCRSKYMHQI